MSSLILRFYYPTKKIPKETYRVIEIIDGAKIQANELVIVVKNKNKNISMFSPFSVKLLKKLVKVGDIIKFNQPILEVSTPYLSNSFERSLIDEKIWNLAIATNAAFKGLLGFMGSSGHIAAKTIPIRKSLPIDEGLDSLISKIVEGCKNIVEFGDVVVLAEKPFALAQKRIFPLHFIEKNDPKRISYEDRIKLLRDLSKITSQSIAETDLLLSDWCIENKNLGRVATYGAFGHNMLSYRVSKRIFESCGKKVDVVISDTDTGIDVKKTIIGCITIGATPLGSTKGLTLYECMRAACAAEFTRGSKKQIPIVICKPALRLRNRNGIGKYRGYKGKLDFEIENELVFV